MNGKLVSAVMLIAIALVAPASIAQEDTESSMNVAKRLYGNGDYRGAIERLTMVVDEDPERAEAHYLIGYAHLMLREYPVSVEAFARAFTADPTLDPRTIYGRPRSTEPSE